jgi:hypothetical protein
MTDQTNCYICKKEVVDVIYDFEEGINLYEFCSKDCQHEYFKNHLSDDCILAIQQTNPDYKATWSGQHLHVFYETRDLTPAQVKAISWHENQKVKISPDEAQKFIEKGEVCCPIEHEELIKGAEEVHPDIARLPLSRLLKDLSEETDDKFESTWQIKRNGVNTWVYIAEITNLWASLVKFNTKEDAYLLTAEMVRKKLGLVKRAWWQFWRK